jgi:hypothetical protein
MLLNEHLGLNLNSGVLTVKKCIDRCGRLILVRYRHIQKTLSTARNRDHPTTSAKTRFLKTQTSTNRPPLYVTLLILIRQ